jgi:hypothetical protein
MAEGGMREPSQSNLLKGLEVLWELPAYDDIVGRERDIHRRLQARHSRLLRSTGLGWRAVDLLGLRENLEGRGADFFVGRKPQNYEGFPTTSLLYFISVVPKATETEPNPTPLGEMPVVAVDSAGNETIWGNLPILDAGQVRRMAGEIVGLCESKVLSGVEADLLSINPELVSFTERT